MNFKTENKQIESIFWGRNLCFIKWHTCRLLAIIKTKKKKEKPSKISQMNEK